MDAFCLAEMGFSYFESSIQGNTDFLWRNTGLCLSQCPHIQNNTLLIHTIVLFAREYIVLLAKYSVNRNYLIETIVHLVCIAKRNI
jgi:hypothetical protein